MKHAYTETNPNEAQIIAALAYIFEAPPSAVVVWLTILQKTFDPRIAQERIVEREWAERAVR